MSYFISLYPPHYLSQCFLTGILMNVGFLIGTVGCHQLLWCPVSQHTHAESPKYKTALETTEEHTNELSMGLYFQETW